MNLENNPIPIIKSTKGPIINHLEGTKWYQHDFNEISNTNKIAENFEELDKTIQTIWKNEIESFENCKFILIFNYLMN